MKKLQKFVQNRCITYSVYSVNYALKRTQNVSIHYGEANCRRSYTRTVVFQVKNGQSFLKNKIQSAVFAFVSGSNRIQVKYGTDLLCSWLVHVKTNYLVCLQCTLCTAFTVYLQ